MTRRAVFWIGIFFARVNRRPLLLVFVEARSGRDDGVTDSAGALGRVAVAETRRATEFVVKVEVEEAWLALAAVTALDILFASAKTCLGVARWRVVPGSIDVTVARLTSVSSEVVVVLLAAVTLVTANSLLALAFAFGVTLERSGAGWVAAAGSTVAIFAHVEVFFASVEGELRENFDRKYDSMDFEQKKHS